MTRYKIVFLLVLCVVVISVGLFQMAASDRSSTTTEKTPQTMLTAPTSTPFPFQELTIPYLRTKSYTSAIETKEVAYETQSYTAYLSTYKSDGLTIGGLLTEPKGTKPEEGWPGIVFIHGYIPPTQYQTTKQYYDYVDYIAKNGFVVFKIDLRGHGTSEGEASGAYYSGDYIIDTLHAYHALASNSKVNPKKIGLWGHSMAGNIVMRSVVVKPDIAVAVIWAGAVYTYADMLEFGIQDGSYQPPPSTSQRQKERQRLRDTYGSFDPDVSFWQQVAVTNYLPEIQGAIQLNHAVNDSVVNVEYSRNLHALLNNTQVIHELKEYQTGGHNISGTAFTEAMKNTVEFYKKHLETK